MAHLNLTATLEQAGIVPARETAKEIFAHCPNPDHDDKHPSWSINKTTGLHSCFSCHYRGTLTQLLVDLTGSAPEDLETTLHQQAFLRTMTEVRERPEEVITPEITEWMLEHQLGDVPQRLLEVRHLRRAAIDRYQVRWEADTRRWVLPIRNDLGALLGVQYRQKGIVTTQPTGMEKSKGLFGYQQALPYDYAVLVESPLDSVRLFGLGIPSVSSLGAWVSKDQVRMMARAFAYVVLALDDDEAGHSAADIAVPMFRRQGCATMSWNYANLTDEDGKKAKDVGDVADDDALLEAWRRTRRWGLN